MSTLLLLTFVLVAMIAVVALGVFYWLSNREAASAEKQRLEYERRMQLDKMNHEQLREEADRIEQELRRGR